MGAEVVQHSVPSCDSWKAPERLRLSSACTSAIEVCHARVGKTTKVYYALGCDTVAIVRIDSASIGGSDEAQQVIAIDNRIRIMKPSKDEALF